MVHKTDAGFWKFPFVAEKDCAGGVIRFQGPLFHAREWAWMYLTFI
jgi:hypothetical protein